MLSASIARHGRGVYRPGESGGDSESTPDTKPVAWAVAGRRGGTCGKSDTKHHTRKEDTMSNTFMRVDDVATELGISKSYAYKIVRRLNTELKDIGYLTVAGRVNKKFFLEKLCYGEKERMVQNGSL